MREGFLSLFHSLSLFFSIFVLRRKKNRIPRLKFPATFTHTHTNTSTCTALLLFHHEGTCRGPGITQNALPCIVELFLSVHWRGVRGSSLPKDGSGPFTASILLSPRPLSPRATRFLVPLHVCISLNVCVCVYTYVCVRKSASERET